MIFLDESEFIFWTQFNGFNFCYETTIQHQTFVFTHLNINTYDL